MMPALVWMWLRRLWPVWLAVLLAAVAYVAGYRQRDTAAAAEMAALTADWQQQQLAAERAYSAKLGEAMAETKRWHDYAQRQSVQLAQAYQRLDGRKNQIKQEISDAVQNDAQNSACAGGLGPDGLRLYQRALGY